MTIAEDPNSDTAKIRAAEMAMIKAAIAAVRAKVPGIPERADEFIRAVLIYAIGYGQQVGSKNTAKSVVPIYQEGRAEFDAIAQTWGTQPSDHMARFRADAQAAGLEVVEVDIDAEGGVKALADLAEAVAAINDDPTLSTADARAALDALKVTTSEPVDCGHPHHEMNRLTAMMTAYERVATVAARTLGEGGVLAPGGERTPSHEEVVSAVMAIVAGTFFRAGITAAALGMQAAVAQVDAALDADLPAVLRSTLAPF